MISRDEILKGQLCPPELEANLSQLLAALNCFRALYGKPMFVNSGYRNSLHNTGIGGRPNSAHLYCMAADFSDPDQALATWIKEPILVTCGLYMESPLFTENWVHLQTRPALHRIFIP